MINAIFFGINIILSVLVWKFILKPSLLDHYRDKLFSLREEVRDFFISKGIGLDDKIYINLRNIINTHLRFTENMSFTSVAYFSTKIEKDHEIKRYIKNEIERKFKTNDKEMEIFVSNIRNKSINILSTYMIFSSPLLISLLLFVSAVVMPIFLINKIALNIKNELSYLRLAILETSKVIGRYISTEDLEEVSYETSFRNHISNMV